MMRRLHWIAISSMTLGPLVGACTVDSELEAPGAGPEVDTDRTDLGGDGGTLVHLFEWKWGDIAEECETFLGPAGYAGVQISPPSEHIVHDTWWARYQPVSYRLDSRSGTREELIDMIERCDAAGVAIYADMVINHTAALDGGGVGTAGSQWSYKDHPELGYGPEHYHQTCAITDYGNAAEVQGCELLSLPDLDTSAPYVQERIAGYMRELLDLGVAGFRIDAAKHIAPGDIEDILSRAGNPPVFLEVIGAYGEAVQPSWYRHLGLVTEFAYSRDMGTVMLHGKLADLRYVGDGKLASGDALVFTDNHDNQRGHGAGYEPVTFKHGSLYNIANAFMLAWPYGRPKVMSSYEFADGDQGPPAGSGGCDQPDRVCEHRWTTIANMVEFRRQTAGQLVTRWWDNGNDRIAFGRGDRGFVAINAEASRMAETLATGLPAGVYCDIASGDGDSQACAGPTVFVDSNGYATFYAEPETATAVHVGARLADVRDGDVHFTCHGGDTYEGQSVYVVGNVPELGNWDPAQAIKLEPEHYPSWARTVSLGTSRDIEWKCLKRDDADPAAGIEWQQGGNNALTTPAAGAVLANGSF